MSGDKTDEQEFSIDFEESNEDVFSQTVGFALRAPDDGLSENVLQTQMSHILETLTRVGGEVCRLRAEVDGLLDQNGALVESFRRLREVLEEKGALDMEDFDLACEVMNANPGNAGESPETLKKNLH